jgi:5-formyltetrahydrofolate cyclo-ligase
LKEKLRHVALNNIKSINLSDKQELDSLVTKNLDGFLEDFLIQKPSKIQIGLYSPLKSEIDWRQSRLVKDFDICLPVMNVSQSGEMSFYQFDYSYVETVSGIRFDMSKSSGLSEELDMVVVPGLGYTRAGDRLGRGAGYYDRYLENYKGAKIGVIYEQLLISDLAVEAHDMKVDFLITEKNIYNCKE